MSSHRESRDSISMDATAEHSGRRVGALRRFGKLAAEQAVPIAVGLVSLVVAVDAWLSARPLEFEKQRALASVRTRATSIPAGRGEHESVTTIRITNVGLLTFAILDLKINIELSGDLTADWSRNSLAAATGGALPIGLRPFSFERIDARHGRFKFDDRVKSWHVVDPGRSVEITFVQPTKGSGRMAISVDAFTQPMMLQTVSEAITVKDTVAGMPRNLMPEWGTGEVSNMAVFPYTSATILVIPKAF